MNSPDVALGGLPRVLRSPQSSRLQVAINGRVWHGRHKASSSIGRQPHRAGPNLLEDHVQNKHEGAVELPGGGPRPRRSGRSRAYPFLGEVKHPLRPRDSAVETDVSTTSDHLRGRGVTTSADPRFRDPLRVGAIHKRVGVVTADIGQAEPSWTPATVVPTNCHRTDTFIDERAFSLV